MMAPEAATLLELKNWSLSRRHAGQEINLLENINLKVKQGQWLAILGANGSGKSSLLKYLASEDSPLSEDAAIMFQDPDDQIIARTVDRELTLGHVGMEPLPVLKDFDLQGLSHLDPRLLSAGQKQRLVLAVSLAGSPTVLLADEPTALQDETQSKWVLKKLQTWVGTPGHTLITATCDRAEAAMSDHLLVLEKGKVVLSGPTSDCIGHELVTNLVGGQLAGTVDIPSFKEPETTAPAVLQLRDFHIRFDARGEGLVIDELSVHPGQRLGITGRNGCGKSTLLAACAGARKPDRGQVVLQQKELYQKQVLDLDHGLAMLAPQFPEYLFTRTTVEAEIDLDPALAQRVNESFLEEIGLPMSVSQRNPHSMSSGQRRRLALGLVLFSNRPLLLLDEPTAALDRAGRQQILSLLGQLPEHSSLMVASHDPEFLEAAGCEILDLDNFCLKL
ncbi:MAG: ATP-binding cassette domain-containing protein [bacterium]|nr:ATP-binding cassette domain-containing protein [bacterium]